MRGAEVAALNMFKDDGMFGMIVSLFEPGSAGCSFVSSVCRRLSAWPAKAMAPRQEVEVN